MENKNQHGLTPQDIRESNKQLFLSALRDGSKTIAEISSLLHLSLTAVNNIAVELIKSNIIKNTGTKSNISAGRRAAVFSINPNYGVVILIEFASSYKHNYYRVIACNLKEDILAIRQIPPIIGDTTALITSLLETIDNLLVQDKTLGLPLLNICISAPGMIDTETGLLIATCLKKNDEEFNLKDALQSHYAVPIHIRSLLGSAAKAELKKGALVGGTKLGILFNIDSGIGMSFIINSQPFTGAHGFAGEIGFLKDKMTSGYNETLSDRLTVGLENEISIEAMKRNICKELNLDINEFSTQALLNEFNNNNTVVLNEIKRNAILVGGLIKNITILLDPDTIIINGLVRSFGAFYLNIITDCLTTVSQKRTKIIYSELDDAIYLGILDTAITAALSAIT